MLHSIQATYEPDIMIFDMPSILVGDNTRAFLKNVDCALIVARANNTKYGHFDACEREIAEYTNVLGVVLNAFPTKDSQNYMD
jgi:Mrp family chromosome partitioning ATPase